MKLKFESNQQYQTEAVKSVISLFEGQSLKRGDFELGSVSDLGFKEVGFGNPVLIPEETLLQNLNSVQKLNELELSGKLEKMSFIDTDELGRTYNVDSEFPNFTIEMETGTGKTYVYLKTIYELYKFYGFQKFVIVVPSVAIREGVIKNLEITHEHFQDLYDKVPVKFDVYDSKKIVQLKNFAINNNIQILVINIDSFTRLDNIILQTRDNTNGKKPIEYIQATKPVVILDEPQNMETDIRKKAIANLNPCFTLRYSATHKNIYNLIYKLDPVKAYDLGLVKQIEVDSIMAQNNFNRGYIELEKFKPGKTKLSAKIKIDVNTGDGVKRKSVSVDSRANDLFELSNKREIYKDLFVNDLNIDEGFIELSDGERIKLGEKRGALTDVILKTQMRNTIEEHFQKQKSYKDLNIKVLSLFFIDKVSNYREIDSNGKSIPGKFAVWFNEIYNDVQKNNPDTIKFSAEEVHNGYFAQDKSGNWKDSSGATVADEDAYQLIMKDKERLLDPEVPLRFIFSHSALKEGWDNPNVFQICTLREIGTERERRQTIGRGLRLCVNIFGERVFEKPINKLTVIANESYEDFAKQLQTEIEQDCGVNFTGRVKDKRDRQKVTLRKGFDLDPNFIELWNKIKSKTTYRVEYKSETLINEAAKEVGNMPQIRKTVIRSIKASITMSKEKVGTVEGRFRDTVINEDSLFIPDVVGYIQERTQITRKTILEILKQSGRLPDVIKNPQMFLDFSIKAITDVLNKFMIDGIKYIKIAGEEYEMHRFNSDEIETYKEHLYAVKNQNKTIADYIVIDSLSSVEKKFAEDCENNSDVEFFIKLPSWFVIPTPIGKYNPDWALIFKNQNRLYFVAETKSTTDTEKLRPSEKQKIKCGMAHFRVFDGVKFEHVSKLSELTIN